MKIYITKRQLEEVIGADFSYFNQDNDDFNCYKGNREVTTGDQIDGEDNSEPIITDKYAKNLSPRYYYGHRDVRGTIACAKDAHGSILESNQDMVNNTYVIPDELYDYLKSILASYKGDKTVEGYKRLNNLITNKVITNNEMYRLKNFLDHTPSNSIEYNLIGGDKLKSWIDNELDKATEMSYMHKDAKRKMGQPNAFIRPHTKGANNSHSTLTQNAKITYEK